MCFCPTCKRMAVIKNDQTVDSWQGHHATGAASMKLLGHVMEQALWKWFWVSTISPDPQADVHSLVHVYLSQMLYKYIQMWWRNLVVLARTFNSSISEAEVDLIPEQPRLLYSDTLSQKTVKEFMYLTEDKCTKYLQNSLFGQSQLIHDSIKLQTTKLQSTVGYAGKWC